MKYTSSLEGITVDMLKGGFFVGWPNPLGHLVKEWDIKDHAVKIQNYLITAKAPGLFCLP
ncbi:hypothetical protein [Thermoflavimicrobium dichotomicum]|uniref:Uncharacterized protein n=1 Tax=Thermoflavimicrobium dichotomicum TaxID=46223 RepID=A0A1I3PDW6_9BACL|nr:hypothetical protein [Thermoflavimicrobium dichotomicum]SFJ19206.1 hypothetical protein SAMN05421852_105177 [Thermoflavimicrobium dichotomicum]